MDSNVQQKTRSKKTEVVKKLVPIIDTRGMKAKANSSHVGKKQNQQVEKNNAIKVSDRERENLNKIDTLTSNEILDGNEAAEEGSERDMQPQEANHDGIEISIHGSDDEFTEEDTALDGTEPGELSSSDDESDQRFDQGKYGKTNRVASKVVKVNQRADNNNEQSHQSRLSKFQHLKDDPDFKLFLNEVVDERMAGRRRSSDSRKRKSSKAKGTEEYVDETHGNEINHHDNHHVNMVKSPSDTTIYSPGLRKASREDVALIEKISNFVESIRIDDRKNQRTKLKTHSRDRSRTPVRHQVQDSRRIEARDVTHSDEVRSPGSISARSIQRERERETRLDPIIAVFGMKMCNIDRNLIG